MYTIKIQTRVLGVKQNNKILKKFTLLICLASSAWNSYHHKLNTNKTCKTVEKGNLFHVELKIAI